MLSPRQIFEDNIRPADLLLKVFRLLEHDAPNTEEELLRSLRELVKAEKDENLLVISNGIFLGLIRELAEVPPASIKRSALGNLLRQAVVTASTAMETYLPILLRDNLPEVIRLRGRDFVPKKDDEIKNQFKNLTFASTTALNYGNPGINENTGEILAPSNAAFLQLRDTTGALRNTNNAGAPRQIQLGLRLKF